MPSRSRLSRPEKGSSISITRGRGASARASATRCCSPPDSWCGCLAPKPCQVHPLQQFGHPAVAWAPGRRAGRRPRWPPPSDAETARNPETSARRRAVPAAGAVHRRAATRAVDPDAPPSAPLHPGDDAQRGGLAAARRAPAGRSPAPPPPSATRHPPPAGRRRRGSGSRSQAGGGSGSSGSREKRSGKPIAARPRPCKHGPIGSRRWPGSPLHRPAGSRNRRCCRRSRRLQGSRWPPPRGRSAAPQRR
jgi:hypothetical protein